MATKEHEKLAAEDQNGEREQRRSEIGRQVLRSLGQPDNFRSVDVRPLWSRCYRANVLVGPDATSVKIAHSYFLTADSEGSIIQSNPLITRMYGAETSDPYPIPRPVPELCDTDHENSGGN